MPSTRHTLAVPLVAPVTTRRPSGLKSMVLTDDPMSSTTGVPVPSALHTRAVPSWEAVATNCPSGLKVMKLIFLV